MESLATFGQWPMLAAIGDIHWPYFLAPIGGIAALFMALTFYKKVMERSEGDDEMVRIAQAVREGAMAYLTRQYKVVGAVFVALVVFLGILWQLDLQPGLTMLGVPIAGTLSALAGWFGMKMATNASARTANAAKESLNEGLTIAFRAGAVMGLVVVGFAILDISFWFLVLNLIGVGDDLRALTTVMLSYGMGASTQALFARVGGGIYTKAADVGADLVGKVEAGIPEDDARNPATIADNVGDNVGDVAGMGADLYESYYGSILATLALGAAAAFTLTNLPTGEQAGLAAKMAAAPLGLAGLGILCSIVGVFTVKAKENATFAQLLKGLHMGVWTASALIIVLAGILLFALFGTTEMPQGTPFTWYGLWGSIAAGLLAGLVIAQATEYYTSYEHPPTQRVSHQGLTGPATVIISGVAEGMKSTWAALGTVVVAIILAFSFAGGGESFLFGLYGVGFAAVGMLSTLGITLATDAYGPIADNAGGNAEMTGQDPMVRERTDMLDSLGNTTAATGKGFAIGSAALTALALFAAYVQVVQTQITNQAVAFAQSEAYTAPAGEEPFAVYEGFGKFAIVVPGGDAETGENYYSGGILVDRMQMTREDYHHLERGQVFENIQPLRADSVLDARLVQLTATVEHGDHDHRYEFEIANTRNSRIADLLAYYDVTLTNPRVLGGLFMGVLLAFLFCALTMNAVGRAANRMMVECRRQFGKMREAFRAQGLTDEQIADPMQWPKTTEHEGTRYPDYATCVSISTAGAQREMVLPALLAIAVPILVGLVLSVPGVMGLLAGGLVSGFAVAVFMANAGGAWDNAKKLVESYGRISANDLVNSAEVRNKLPENLREPLELRAQDMIRAGRGDEPVYGKGSEDHKANVVGDTVGDPFKDTSGPSLNILIKLISVVSVVFAGLVVKYGPAIGEMIGLG